MSWDDNKGLISVRLEEALKVPVTPSTIYNFKHHKKSIDSQ